MLLRDKCVVIYGAGGALGAAVSRTFAGEGARLFLAGRTVTRLEAVAEQIRAGGGVAESMELDALDARAVEQHAAGVVKAAGRLDISINLIGVDHIQGRALLEMTPDEFTRGLEDRVRTHVITARAAARHMTRQRTGVILMVTAAPDRLGIPRVGSFGVACAALEGLARTLATELGPEGVRVVCLRSAGSPDADGVRKARDLVADGVGTAADRFQAAREERALLRRLPLLAEVAAVAALLASDRAGAMTATIANVTCGELLD